MTDAAAERISTVRGSTQIDMASILGITFGFLTLGVGIFLGGSAPAFLNLPSVFIVLGGTIGVTLACTTFRNARGLLSSLGMVIRRRHLSLVDTGRQMIETTKVARTSGLLSLQNYYDVLRAQPMLFKGITMVVDGASESEVDKVVELEVESARQKREAVINLLNKAGDISPAMGLLGTLIGLVQMLVQLEDPSSIGPAMAVALLTTFYGVILSNMVFLPAATKLEYYNEHMIQVDRIYALTILSLQRQENPRRLEMQINTMLPPGEQISEFD